MWLVFGGLIAFVLLMVFAIQQGWIGYMPPLDELQSPISKFASQIITSDGKVIGTWSKNENRIFVDYDSISPNVFEALIATEDERFYEHSGIDGRALGRAIVKRGILRQSSAGGGSTITQQLAKQLYSGQATSKIQRLFQKPIEWVIAVELERYYTKEEILTLYLNYFDFLHNAVGIKTAAEVYFGKHPRNLSLNEAATLVGMCKNPSYFNPVRNMERCVARRNVVLQQMVKTNALSQAEYEQISAEPIPLKFRRVDHKKGDAPYLREYLRRIMMAQKPDKSAYPEWQKNQYYEDSLAWETDPLYGWCNKNTKGDGSNYDIYTDGLKVYTTVDSRMQKYAEESVARQVGEVLQPEFNKQKSLTSNFPYSSNLSRQQVNNILKRAMRQSERYRMLKFYNASEADIEKSFNTPTEMTVYGYRGEKDTVMTPMDSIRYYKSILRGAMVSLDPTTGYIKAYVGGLNFKYFQYDMGMVGRRQVGSTVKPFVYAMAMDDGRTPNDIITNIQRSYMVAGHYWTPRNGSRSRYGSGVTLKWGLSQSNNWITAELMHQVDPTGHRFISLLKEFGFARNDLYPSIVQSLGPGEFKVVEMASGYTPFVNRGIRCAPILVTKIEDSQGNIVAEFTPRMNEVISEESSFKMLDMLQAVIDNGTAGRVRYRYDIKGPAAGKTGTTNNNSDGWFVGMVPRLITACWVGGDDRDIRLYSTSVGQGAATALPIWATYMKKVYADKALGYKEDEKFPSPEPAEKAHRGNSSRGSSSSQEYGEEADEQTVESSSAAKAKEDVDNLFE